MDRQLKVEDVRIAGYAQVITLRVYRPVPHRKGLPVVLYFHGGGFVRGSLDEANVTASRLALDTPALVVSVGYSLAPAFPFPAAPEDAHRAARWAYASARSYGGAPQRIGVAGHDAGANIAASLTLIARDRGEVPIHAQALLAPLIDPSMTRIADETKLREADTDVSDCARCYRAYLPEASQRLHPYAAPLESTRLGGLPAALIASAEHDLLHIEAERYASNLIAAGVPTQVRRHRSVSHSKLPSLPAVLEEVCAFFRQRLGITPAAPVAQFQQ
ncbi:alpha/beta hydrolase [Pararobbsia alpina]|uniref:Carboxylesterase NlhH n=1 Tax=Pararobbsia alpina TaxID=621374 RepID=A0A6S7BRM5_9BURK|nr:alpha/beta hydrolase [Pararobbsia alpina]CAB3792931.1 Carboxylesterase NlhH [Pararobbsia alpina]